MSTEYNNNASNRFAKLAKMNEIIFHANDLANLWGIKNKNTLYTTLKRYTAKGLLVRIHKGFYSLKEIKNLDPFLLGIKFLNQFAYVGAETVLVEEGIIFQRSSFITLISSKSKTFSVGAYNYKSRQLKDEFLYNMFGIKLKNGYYKACTERAIADLLYFSPQYYFDKKDLIDWAKVKKIQKEVGYIKN